VDRITYQKVSDAALSPVRALEALCERHAVPLGALALQFSMRHPGIASTIIGVSRPERVRQTLEWASMAIPDEVFRQASELGYSTVDPEADRVYSPG
jgi:D-threo-aldose 1-dehydrogenase